MSLINNINNFDIFVIIVTIISLLYGYNRGLVKEVLSIFSIFSAGYISTLLYPEISFFIKKYIEMDLLADGISFVVLFIILYSVISIFVNFFVTILYKSPLRVLDKNFGIIFGFLRSLLIFSLLDTLLNWTLWSEKKPLWITNSKSYTIIQYSSQEMLSLLPKSSLLKIENVFNITINSPTNDLLINRNSIEKYNEPIIKKSLEKDKKGYNENDNKSLDRLFNIENE